MDEVKVKVLADFKKFGKLPEGLSRHEKKQTYFLEGLGASLLKVSI